MVFHNISNSKLIAHDFGTSVLDIACYVICSRDALEVDSFQVVILSCTGSNNSLALAKN